MEQLQEHFLERLRERIASLAAAQIVLASDHEARSQVRFIAHALKGAGGTYGFPAITAAAAEVETAADDALPGSLDALLAVLRATVDAAPAPGQAPRERKDPLPRPAAAAGEPARVLVVDDDPDITRLLEHALAAPDRVVDVATSAAALDRLVSRRSYDLMVLDLMLPDADGRTLLAELRQEPRTAGVPIIVLSALQSGPAKTECFALGADAFLEKPFDTSVIAAAVTSMLERSRRLKPDGRTHPDTSLPSCAVFREAFERATAADALGPVAVALFELDQYEALASTAGWASAARALALAGRSLRDVLDPAAALAHWSGATLSALLCGSTTEDAIRSVEHALAAVREVHPEPPAERYTFSAGVVPWTVGHSLAATIVEAERQVLAAKSAGGDAVHSPECAEAAPGHTILLAEDDDLIAAVVAHRLRREGMGVEHFGDGLSALEAMSRLKPALAILDVKMPGMDGFELLRRVRADAALRRLPILMLTSLGSEQDIVRGLDLGADEYMVKPFSPVELVARVRRLLARR